MSTRIRRSALHYVLMAAAILSLLLWFGPATRSDLMLHRTAQTTGSISSLNCKDYGSVAYRFTVDGATYVGVADHGAAGVCDKLQVGDKVAVYYLPGHPQLHQAGNPLRDLLRYLGLAAFVSLLLPILAMSVARLLTAAARSEGDDEEQRLRA